MKKSEEKISEVFSGYCKMFVLKGLDRTKMEKDLVWHYGYGIIRIEGQRELYNCILIFINPTKLQLC